MQLVLNLFIIGTIAMDTFSAEAVPDKPTDIHVLADSFNIGVEWLPPSETFGTIQNYIISFAILPNRTEVTNIVDGQDTLSIIPVGSHAGRLFRIRVSAENDAGIGPYSDARYIRINCLSSYDIFPNTYVTIRSPGYDSGDPIKEGVICTWKLKTNPMYMLTFKMDDLSLVGQKNMIGKLNCIKSGTYLDFEGIGTYCDTNSFRNSVPRSLQSNVTLTLKTGMEAGGRGFQLTATSVMRLPGPPRNVHVTITNHAVIVTWQQPIGNTLPVTSYILRYNIPNSGNSYRIIVGPKMRRFSLNVDRFEGQFLMLNLSAAIGLEEGDQSTPVFVRAPCRRYVHIDTGTSVNITTPNYPEPYPASILCTWELTSDPDVKLVVTFIDFRLEDTSFCSSDFVLFSFKENREPECARIKTPKTISSRRPAFNMTFVTDSKNQFEGFLLQVDAIGKINASGRSTLSTTTKGGHASISQTVVEHSTTGEQSVRTTVYPINITPPTPRRTENTLLETTTSLIKHTTLLNSNTYEIDNSTPLEQGHVKPGLYSTHSPTESITKKGVDPNTALKQFINGRMTNHDHSDAITTETLIGEPRNTTHMSTKSPGIEHQTVIERPAILDEKHGLRLNTRNPLGHQTTVEVKTLIAEKHEPSFNTVKPLGSKGHNVSGSEGNFDATMGTHLVPDRSTGAIVGGTVAILVLLGLLFGIHQCRKRRLRVKIGIQRSGHYKSGHVELHDILSGRHRTESNSYESFDVTNVREASVTPSTTEKNNDEPNKSSKAQPVREVSVKPSTNEKNNDEPNKSFKAQPVREVSVKPSTNEKNNDEPNKSLKAQPVREASVKSSTKEKNSDEPNKSLKAQPVREASAKPSNNGENNGEPSRSLKAHPRTVSRRKHNSFPYCARNRKIAREIKQKMSAFEFIEDKDRLERQIRRKQKTTRAHSF